jgi:hypothetical protein
MLVVAAACGVALSSCGSSAPAGPRYTYGPSPSVSARLICSHNAIGDIDYSLGVRPLRTPIATWHHHRYTCPYHYSDGNMTLFVQELPTLADTFTYMSSLRGSLGDSGAVANLGQGAFATPNGSLVLRKDNKVLVVEVGGLPEMFGVPSTTRAEVAITVALVILACWKGY